MTTDKEQPAIRFRYCYWGDGVLLQETDIDETYMLNHGPYIDTAEAFAAMIVILDGGEPPKPNFHIRRQAA